MGVVVLWERILCANFFILEFGPNIFISISRDRIPQFSALYNQYCIHSDIFPNFFLHVKQFAVLCVNHISWCWHENMRLKSSKLKHKRNKFPSWFHFSCFHFPWNTYSTVILEDLICGGNTNFRQHCKLKTSLSQIDRSRVVFYDLKLLLKY